MGRFRAIYAALAATALLAALALVGCGTQGAQDGTGGPKPPESAELQASGPSAGQEKAMESERIVITVNGQPFAGTLADTGAARDFSALLPLSLTMEELNGNEKYAYLDDPLPADSRNPGTIHAGDVMLFGSSCIVLFYQTFPTQYTYTPIAVLDDAEGLADAVGEGDIEARIDFA